MSLMALCSLAGASLVYGQSSLPFLNLDFEKTLGGRVPKNFFLGAEGYEITISTNEVKSGKNSLQIKQISKGSFGVATATFPVDLVKGKKIKFSGFIRTKEVETMASLWWRVDGPDGILAFNNMTHQPVKGTTDWARYSFELPVAENARNINFGVLLSGSGTAWFDGLEVEIDGKKLEQTEPIPFEPDSRQLDALKKTVRPFQGSDPKQSLDDLAFVKEWVGDARIVGLGEATHGTREFFQMKHRMVRYLVEKMGFTVFGIEATMPECRRLNEYVLEGKGDPRAGLDGIYFWTWNSEEVLAMIEWMREYNKTAAQKVEFWGFDMQFSRGALLEVKPFVESTGSLKLLHQQLSKTLGKIQEQAAMGNLAQPLIDTGEQELQAFEAAFLARKEKALETHSLADWNCAVHNLRILKQLLLLQQNRRHRDESMAENVQWILDQKPPGTKAVLWAHNYHVNRQKGSLSMGSHLAEKHGAGYVVFGFGFHEGQYTAVGPKGLSQYGTSASEPGSFEWAFHKTEVESCMLDLRQAPSLPHLEWLGHTLDFRSIGAHAMEYAFSPSALKKEYDLLIFFNKTTPSVLLHR